MLDNSINTTGREEILNAQYINQDIYLINFYDGNEPEYSKLSEFIKALTKKKILILVRL